MKLSGFTHHDTFLKHRLGILLILVSIVMLITSSGLFYIEQRKTQDKTTVRIVTPKPVKVMVHIAGAVRHPGIYELLETKRLADVIKAAGGVTSDVDNSYYQIHFNQAESIYDSEKIYIPSIEDISSGRFNETIDNSQPEQAGIGLNINTSSDSELVALPGVGKVTAQKIIDGRPYQSIEELVSKSVISEAVFNKISSLIYVD